MNAVYGCSEQGVIAHSLSLPRSFPINASHLSEEDNDWQEENDSLISPTVGALQQAQAYDRHD